MELLDYSIPTTVPDHHTREGEDTEWEKKYFPWPTVTPKTFSSYLKTQGTYS